MYRRLLFCLLWTQIILQCNANINDHSDQGTIFPKGKPGIIYEHVNFGSYKPTNEQIKAAHNLIYSEDAREALQLLLNLIKQSSDDSAVSKEERIEEFNEQLDNMPIAEAAATTSEEEGEQQEPTNVDVSVETPTIIKEMGFHKNQNIQVANVGMGETHKSVGAGNGSERQAPIYSNNGNALLNHHQVRQQPIKPILKKEDIIVATKVCDILLRNSDILSFCKNESLRNQLLHNPTPMYDDEYQVTVEEDHQNKANTHKSLIIEDSHTIIQSVDFLFHKLCVGPLFAACQNIINI
ncbi:hypothetical protein BdWA1_000636 [Babesia duncani]|uniref:Uncharacterized protein n=1 Tax=Babesia duncani TaxID=323732 RepID=A0AAD9UPZ7_9APIC|nr:hypothetical protein BdWA1_000636 [Babesia duncani]